MVDKVKPLKIENPSNGGTQTDPFPREADPTQDYLAAKGLAFDGLDTYLYDKLGGVMHEKFPTTSWKPSYLANGELDNVEFFNGTTQTTANRIARVDLTYDGSLNPTTEIWKIYDTANGTTVLRTLTYTYTWTGVDLTSAQVVTT